jgi:hypothetical protein
MIAYWAVPYLVAAAPPAIVLLTILIGAASEPVDDARSYSDPSSRAGDALARELDRRAAREALRRLIDETQR